MALIRYWGLSDPDDHKGRIAAEYSGVELICASEWWKAPEYLTAPVLEIPDGVFASRSNAIAKYVAQKKPNNPLLGLSDITQDLVAEWINFAETKLEPNLEGWVYPRMCVSPYIAKDEDSLIGNVKRDLGYLNTYLSSNEYLVGQTVTLADIIVSCDLYLGFKNIMTKDFTSEFPHVEKYFWRIAKQPNFKKFWGNFHQAYTLPFGPSSSIFKRVNERLFSCLCGTLPTEF